MFSSFVFLLSVTLVRFSAPLVGVVASTGGMLRVGSGRGRGKVVWLFSSSCGAPVAGDKV